MRKNFILFILLIQFIPLHSLDLSENYYDGEINPSMVDNRLKGSISSFYFEDSNYEFWHSLEWLDEKDHGIPERYLAEDSGLGYIETGHYLIRDQENFHYLKLESDTGFTFKTELGVLFHPRRMYLYEEDNLFFMSTERFGHDSESGPYVESIKTSSYLVEGSIEYKGRNIIRPFFEISKPWVEGVSGDGIGQWIELETSAMKYPVRSFLISNGYVSFEKPYLYKYNNRVKSLRVTCDQLNIDFEVVLEDTPNFQEVRLPVKIEEKNTTFRFEILEVYEGLKWDDTCINLIIPLGDM